MISTTQGYAGLKQTLRTYNTSILAGSGVVRRVRRVAAHVCVYFFSIICICSIINIFIFLSHIRGFNPAYPAYPSQRVINKGFEATQGLFQPCVALRGEI